MDISINEDTYGTTANVIYDMIPLYCDAVPFGGVPCNAQEYDPIIQYGTGTETV